MTGPAIPRLSIVIPAYNVERYVGAAIASALAQTLREIEVVVVDDGSTDGTAAVVRGFDDPRLVLVAKANGGLSSARNAGIAAARAPLVGFLDGDDLWMPEKAARHVEALDAEPSVGLTFSHSAYVDEAGASLDRYLFSTLASPTLRQMIARNRVGNGSSPVVRTECLRRAGPFDEALKACEDWEMWVRILRDTPYAARLVPEVLTRYRINTLSLSMDFERFLRNADLAAAKVLRETPGVPPRLVARGLAMSYRIAGTKAFFGGDRRTAARYVGQALRISPWLLATDPRCAGTIAAILAPRGLVALGQRLLWAAMARLPSSKPPIPDDLRAPPRR